MSSTPINAHVYFRHGLIGLQDNWVVKLKSSLHLLLILPLSILLFASCVLWQGRQCQNWSMIAFDSIAMIWWLWFSYSYTFTHAKSSCNDPPPVHHDDLCSYCYFMQSWQWATNSYSGSHTINCIHLSTNVIHSIIHIKSPGWILVGVPHVMRFTLSSFTWLYKCQVNHSWGTFVGHLVPIWHV